MAKVFCEYCGREFNSVRDMLNESCNKHPDGINKGRHAPYEGVIDDKYMCEYCGREFRSYRELIFENCNKHPDGINKGIHKAM